MPSIICGYDECVYPNDDFTLEAKCLWCDKNAQELLNYRSRVISNRFPASEDAVREVLNAPVIDDGRSPFYWAWTEAGDRMLIIYPHGDTFFATEIAAAGDYKIAKRNGTLEYLGDE